MKPIQVAGRTCTMGEDCARVLVADWRAHVQGDLVTDPGLLAAARPGAGESVVMIPLSMLLIAALRALFVAVPALLVRSLRVRLDAVR